MFSLFDNYNRQARLFPGLLTVFVPLLTALAWFPALITSSIGATLLTIASSCGLLYGLSSVARTLGKRVETRLLLQWGGWPTTILLRHSSKLDAYTRQRYHQCLSASIPNLTLPTPEQERKDPNGADAVYASAVNWLKEQTRGKSFPLIERENAQYGFRRNLRGMKTWGIIGCLLAFILSLTGLLFTKPEILRALNTYSFAEAWGYVVGAHAAVATTLVISFIALVCWIFLVTDTWVKEAAYQYAERLLAACETLSKGAAAKKPRKPSGKPKVA